MVQHLKTDRLMRPFDILCTSMNFWRAFVPASERGISFRCEVFVEDTGTTVAWPMEVPERPLADGDYTLGHLMYAVGLPVQNDAEKSVSDLRSDWDALAGPNPVPHGRIKDAVIEERKLRATRAFIAELDNFPAMSSAGLRRRAPSNTSARACIRFAAGETRSTGCSGRCKARAMCRSGEAGSASCGPAAPGAATIPSSCWGTPSRFSPTPRCCSCAPPRRKSAAAEPADYATATEGATVADGTAEFRAIRVVFDSNPLVVVVSSFRAGRAVNYRSDGFIAISTRPEPSRFRSRRNRWVSSSISTRMTLRAMSASIPAGPSRTKWPLVRPGRRIYRAPRQGLYGHAGKSRPRPEPADRSRFPDQQSDRRDADPVELATDPQGRGHPGHDRRGRLPAFQIGVRGQAWQFAKDDTVLLRFRAPGQFLGSAYVNPRGNDTFYVLGDTRHGCHQRPAAVRGHHRGEHPRPRSRPTMRRQPTERRSTTARRRSAPSQP